VAAHPSQESGALDRDALRGPWRIEAAVDDARPGRPVMAATDVGDATWVPPRLSRGSRFISVRVRSWHWDGRDERRIEARKGIVEPSLASECPGEAGKIAARSSRSRGWVRVVGVDSDEQPGERPNVLAVVPDDVEQGIGRSTAEEVEEPPGDLPAIDVAVADASENLGLDGSKARVGHPMAEDAPDEGQQIEVTRERRGSGSNHPVASDEERPVEPSPVVRHEPTVRRDVTGKSCEQSWLRGVVREQELYLSESVFLPPAEADEKRDRSGRRRKPGRLRVQADERDVRWRQAWQHRKSFAVERQDDGRGLASHHGSRLVEEQLTVDGLREPASELDGAATNSAITPVTGLATAGGERRPVVREPPIEACACHADAAVRSAPTALGGTLAPS
jgi:hypothetical protein